MRSDVFISYSSKDEKIAYVIYENLKQNGIKCWIADKNIIAGEFANSIIEGIKKSKVMLLIFSSSSNESVNVLREIDIAMNNELTIIPIRIEDIKPTESMAYYLSTIHWIDMFNITSNKQLKELTKIISLSINKNLKSLDEIIEKREKKSYLKFKIVFPLFLISVIWLNLNTVKQIMNPYFSKRDIIENNETFPITEDLLMYQLSHDFTDKEWNNFIEKDFKILDKEFDQLPKSILDSMNSDYIIDKLLLIEYKNLMDDYQKLQRKKSIKNIYSIAEIHFNLGRFYSNNLKNSSLALNEYKKALILYKQMNNRIFKTRYIAHSYYALGNIYRKTSQYHKAEKNYLKSLEIYKEALKVDKYVDKVMIGDVYFELGALYTNILEYEKSIVYTEQSLKFYYTMENTDSKKIEYIKNVHLNMAFNYKKLEQFENAIQEYNKKIKLYQKVKEQNPNFYKYEIVQEYKDISLLYFHQKQYQKAIDIEMKILEIVKSFDESFIKKNLLMGAVYDRIGEDYELLENKEESIKNYNSALLFYRKDKNKNRKAIERVVLSLEKLELKIESK